MHIEILTEDKSGAVVVQRLTRRICEIEGVEASVEVRPHRGCGSIPKMPDERPAKFASALLDLLPAKCRAYNRVYGNTDTILVVVMDSDDNDPEELRAKLYSCCKRYAPDVRSVVGLCTEEIEAWLLGDSAAIYSAYPDSDERALASYKQDSVCGTWEQLCRVVCPDNADDIIEIGYPAIGHYKARWAEEISEFMEPMNNVSPSFKNYYNSLATAMRNPEPIPRMGANVTKRTLVNGHLVRKITF